MDNLLQQFYIHKGRQPFQELQLGNLLNRQNF
jgi:hypothetical protein